MSARQASAWTRRSLYAAALLAALSAHAQVGFNVERSLTPADLDAMTEAHIAGQADPLAHDPDARGAVNLIPLALMLHVEALADAAASRRPAQIRNPAVIGDPNATNIGAAIGYPVDAAADAAQQALELGYALPLVVEEVAYQFGNAGLPEMVARVLYLRGQGAKDVIRDAVRQAARRRAEERAAALREQGPAGPWRALVLEPIDLSLVDFGEFMAGVRDLMPNDDPGGSASVQ